MYEKGLRYRPDDKASCKRKQEAEDHASRYIIIYFDINAYAISERYAGRLDQIGEAIRADGPKTGLEIVVTGHTCSLGRKGYNEWLSLMRARAAADYLEEKFSVPPELLKVTGHGEDLPLLRGEDKNARALNRRVEVTLRYRGG